MSSPLSYRIAHLFCSLILHLLFNFEISGKANVHLHRPYLAVANHLNWLDSFALLVAMPRDPRVHLLGWSGVTSSSRLAWLIHVTKVGFIPVERDPHRRAQQRRQLRDSLTQCLARGYPLAIFPEGQVGCDEGRVGTFMPGFAHLSLSTGAPVVPVAFSGTRELWLRKRIRIDIGPPIDPDCSSGDALVDKARDALCDLMPRYNDPGGLKLFRRRLTRLIPSLTNWSSSDL